MRCGTPRLQAVVCSRGLFAVCLHHRPATSDINGRNRVETQGILRRYDGRLRTQSKIHGLEADKFHVINAHPAAGKKIEDGTDLVRPATI